MRTAIVFASKHGTTEQVAGNIRERLIDDEVVLFNLAEKKRIELRSFDRILIGSSVYVGKIQPRVRKFVEQNMVDLLQKEIGLFVCCMFFEKADEQIEKSFSAVIRKHARSIKHMGGEYRFEEMNAIERFLLKTIAGATSSESKINQNNIDSFIAEINKN